MKKSTILMSLFSTVLIASTQTKSYSIQILSYPIGHRSLSDPQRFDPSCYRVERHGYEAVRCGCFSHYNEVIETWLPQYRQKYPDAFVSNCDVESFQKKKSTHGKVIHKNIHLLTPNMGSKKNKTGRQDRIEVKSSSLLDKIYESFVYSHDLIHAQQTVVLALRQGKEKIKWLKRGIEVAVWLGETEKAMALMKRLYRLTKDPNIRKKLIDYALQSYHYRQALYLMLQSSNSFKNPADIEKVSYLYQQVGLPEKAYNFLYRAWKRNPEKRMWLLDALQIALNLGDMKSAEKMVHDLRSIGLKTLRGAEEVSYYYFINRDLRKAYLTFLGFNPNLLEHDEERSAYYRKLSDLGWLVGDYKRAMEASCYLIRLGNATQNDYNRVILEANHRDPKLALETAMEAFEKYGTENYFYTAAYLADRLKEYDRLSDLFSIVEQYDLEKKLSKKPDYYLILSTLELHLKNIPHARNALKRAYSLAPDNARVLSQLLWFYYDNNMTNDMKKIAARIEANIYPIDPILYPNLIAVHMKLQQSDLARYYMQKLYKSQKKNLTIDEKAGMAYLLQQQMRMNYYKNMMLKLYRELEEERQKDRAKMKDPLFVDAWLRAAMEFVNPDIFEKRLKKAKKVLSKKRYKELSVLWDIRLSEFEKANQKISRWKDAEPWIALSLALYNHDLTAIQDMLYKYGDILPIRDRVLAARKDRQIALAQTFAFEGMEDNRWDYLLFYQREQLMRAESDRYVIHGSWEDRESLTRKRFVLKNRNKLPRGWSLREKVQYSANEEVDHRNLKEIPLEQKGIDVILAKRFDRGTAHIVGGYRDAMERYGTAAFFADWILTQRWHASAGYYFHEDTEDTTYLMLGGYQNRTHFSADFKLLNSTTLEGHGDYVEYRGQDDEKAGNGWKTGLSLYHLFRTGYPDIQFSLYTEYGRFNQRMNQEGVLRKLMMHPEYETATPSDYFLVGGGLYVGYENYSDYIRAWRWYAGISPYYDYETNKGSTGGELGVGGSLFQQDHLDLGVRYTPAFYSGQESLTTLYFLYRMMY